MYLIVSINKCIYFLSFSNSSTLSYCDLCLSLLKLLGRVLTGRGGALGILDVPFSINVEPKTSSLSLSQSWLSLISVVTESCFVCCLLIWFIIVDLEISDIWFLLTKIWLVAKELVAWRVTFEVMIWFVLLLKVLHWS